MIPLNEDSLRGVAAVLFWFWAPPSGNFRHFAIWADSRAISTFSRFLTRHDSHLRYTHKKKPQSILKI